MSLYYLGNQARLAFEVTDAVLGLVTPDTIVLTLTDPAGTVTTPSLSNTSKGVYVATLTPSLAGHYTWTLVTTGTGAAKKFGSFDVIDGQVTLSGITLGDLIDEVLTNLHGYTSDLEQLTHLTSVVSTTDTTFNVGDATQVTRGLIEIDGELMWVQAVDQTNNSVTIAPFGRGFRETDAASHTVNAMVMNNPRFPRSAVKLSIQQTLGAVYPDLFQVLVDETNSVIPVQVTYPVPGNADVLLGIQWKNIGPSKLWVPVQRWRFDPNSDRTVFPTGKSVEIYDGMIPGQPIKITYIAAPGQLSSESDSLGLTGLADTARDVLVFGACYRLLTNLESSRLQTWSIEQSERAQLTPPGAATAASKYYFALYNQALQREALRLQKFYPTRSHLVR